MPFMFTPLEIPDLILVVPRVFPDDRGFFFETYKATEFEAHGIPGTFVQDNHSISHRNVLRGLHYQLPPAAQGKLVRVVRGKAWDVAVDIRKNSPTFRKWAAVELSDENHYMLYVPPGFAHGFVAMSENVHLMYKCTAEYSPQHERGICWDDPDIDVQWPVDIPKVSERDDKLPMLYEAEVF